MATDLYQHFHKFEWDQKAALTSAINIPIVAATGLATAMAAIALGYPYASTS